LVKRAVNEAGTDMYLIYNMKCMENRGYKTMKERNKSEKGMLCINPITANN